MVENMVVCKNAVGILRTTDGEGGFRILRGWGRCTDFGIDFGMLDVSHVTDALLV